MTLPEPIRSFWYAMEELNPVARRTHWGIVVSDPRFPRVYDANKACVLEADAELTMQDIRFELLPVLDQGGIAFEHVEFMDLNDDCQALQDLADGAGWNEVDVLMVHAGEGAVSPDLRAPQDDLEVREVEEPDEAFWAVYRDSRNGFGATMPDEVVDELVRRDREGLRPAGLRIFVGLIGDQVAGFASLLSREGAGYVDNVVTLEDFRRRGVAGATVMAAVRAGREQGDAVFLLAEEGGAPQRLYERLGFRVQRRAAGFTHPREGGAQAPVYL